MRTLFIKWIESKKVITGTAGAILFMLLYELIKEIAGGREYLIVGVIAFLSSYAAYEIGYKDGKADFDKQ